MEIPTNLRTLYSAEVTEQQGSYVIEVPKREIEQGDLQPGAVYRIGILSIPITNEGEAEATRERSVPEPPVEEGDHREVEIEDIGEQGDGIARVERGFVIIVPETEKGERVTIEITEVRETVAFGEVVERHHF